MPRHSVSSFLQVFGSSVGHLFASLLIYVSSLYLLGVGNLLAATFCTLISLFTGLSVTLSSVTPFLSWIKWLSIFRYAYNLCAINELTGLRLEGSRGERNYTLGEEILKEQNIDYETTWDLWKNFVALLVMTAIFLLFAYVQLLRMKKTR